MNSDNEHDYYNQFDDDKNTKLHHDAARCEFLEVQGALEKGEVKVDPENFLGWTPLMMAARNGNFEIVKLLIEYKADATKKNLYGSSVFLMAIASGNMEMIHFLLQHLLRGGVSKQSMEVILSPITVALLFEQVPIINFLITNSFNVNIAAPLTAITPIMVTGMQNNDALFQLLISKGADPFVKNINKQSAYEIMSSKKQKKNSSSQQRPKQHPHEHNHKQQNHKQQNQQQQNHQQHNHQQNKHQQYNHEQHNHEQHNHQQHNQEPHNQQQPTQQQHNHQPHNLQQPHLHLYHQPHQSVYLSPQCHSKPVPVLYLSPSPNFFSPHPNNPLPLGKSSNATPPPYLMLPSVSPIPPMLSHQVFFPPNFHPNTVLSPGNICSCTPDGVFSNHHAHMSYHNVVSQMNE